MTGNSSAHPLVCSESVKLEVLISCEFLKVNKSPLAVLRENSRLIYSKG